MNDYRRMELKGRLPVVKELRTWFAIFQNLVRGWWRKDRIRLSPVVGHWLRFQVGDSLLIREMLFEVIARNTMISSKTLHVTLQLRRCDEYSDCDTVLQIVFEGPKLEFVSSTLTMADEVIGLLDDDAVIVSSNPTTYAT